MRLNVCFFNEMALFGLFAALERKIITHLDLLSSSYKAVATMVEMEVSPQEEMANP